MSIAWDTTRVGLGITTIILGFFVIMKAATWLRKFDNWLYKKTGLDKMEKWANK